MASCASAVVVTAMPSQGCPCIDAQRVSVLRELVPAGGRSLFASVAEVFVQQSSPGLAAMRQALEGDSSALQEGAHNLKGAAANVGAVTVAALCQELEVAVRSGDEPRTIDLLNQLDGALERAIRCLLDLSEPR